MPFRTDEHYLEILLAPIRTCADYLPKLGHGATAGYDLAGFQGIYGSDPFYSWLGLDNPLMFSAHKAAGGMTSIYRQIGIGSERLFRQLLQDSFDLTEAEASWEYAKATAGGKTQKLYLDGRIDLEHLKNPAQKEKVRTWMDQACSRLGVAPAIAGALKGIVFEIRQGYKSKDSKRQNGDIGNASTAYIRGYLPVVAVMSLQIDDDIETRYTMEKWVVLKGLTAGANAQNSIYAFSAEVIGYDLAAFFSRQKKALRDAVEIVLKKLLSPDGNPEHAPKK